MPIRGTAKPHEHELLHGSFDKYHGIGLCVRALFTFSGRRGLHNLTELKGHMALLSVAMGKTTMHARFACAISSLPFEES